MRLYRAHQLEFLVLGHVAQMDGAEFSERDVDADRHRILGVALCGLEVRAIGIGSAGARQRRLDGLAGGRHDLHIETGDRNLVARFGDRVFGIGVELRVDLRQEFIDRGGRLGVRAVVDEMPDRDALGEFRQAAIMIAVPMGDDQIVDLGQPGIPGGRHDAPGIADRRGRRDVAGVDQQRLAGRRDEQRGVAAFDVDDVDVQGRAGLRRSAVMSGLDQQGRQTGRRGEQHVLAHGILPVGPIGTFACALPRCGPNFSGPPES